MDRIDVKRLPRHIAIIMDGNGRWAKKKRLPRVEGHRRGVKTVDKIVTLCAEMHIEALTLYSFSDENWNRPRAEVEALMKILDQYLHRELERMKRENIRFNTIGRIYELPPSIQELIRHAEDYTRDNDGLVLTLALSYGGRQEIVDAVKTIAQKVQEGSLHIEDIDFPVLESSLYTHDLPEPDLLIRTSGEKRISNFLLYQLAYTELHYTQVLWPEFTEDDLLKAIIDFQNRERRFGLIGDQIVKA
ncbi:MAG: isoprenyl transferase [Nitrospinaceae bacterium]|nr:isoprenyl transferase [Nitrospinaceae bacterium]NIR54923.1 isoprenyl transferase [Nitrospinaceae bacterium]NIS85351.1 isoprenyl transferase [Nitrospinaceae bacterium]NIT82165.1 isoprenyl transferase [Nitrospinaceae bacterium]NIU44419.1 isoprenyl transferase [Nitrospinaceae bacterium]